LTNYSAETDIGYCTTSTTKTPSDNGDSHDYSKHVISDDVRVI